MLLPRRSAIESLLLAIDQQPDIRVTCNHGLKRKPPQFANAIRKTGRDIDREWRLVPLEDWIGVFERVAITVIDRYADKSALEILLGKASLHLIETDDFQPGAPEKLEDTFQECGRYFEKAVWLEAVP